MSLFLNNYFYFFYFTTYVLEKAQNEINDLTDINIHFEPIFKGRKVVKVKFRIEEKNTMQRVISIAKTNEILVQKTK